jgi:hypothetical protein
MLDQFIKLVEQNAGEAIVKNKAIPDQHNNAAIQAVAQQIFNGLKTQASQGNLQQIAGMFQGGTKASLTNNPMVTQLISQVAGTVASKFGVSPQAAQSMAASLLPTVMSQFVKKTNDPNDNTFDLTNVMRGLSGNNSLDVNNLIGQVTGNKGGDVLGNIGDMLGGMFKK